MVACFGHQGAIILFKTHGERIDGTVSRSDLGLFAVGWTSGGERQGVIPDGNNQFAIHDFKKKKFLHRIPQRKHNSY